MANRKNTMRKSRKNNVVARKNRKNTRKNAAARKNRKATRRANRK